MATIAASTADPLQLLWDAYRTKVVAWEADGAPFDGPSVSAMIEKEDRFIDAHTTSLAGILLKLEHVAETENLAKDPSMTISRLVFGLIMDLRSELART